jgi:hypothetical protein
VICNLGVVGSNPTRGSPIYKHFPKFGKCFFISRNYFYLRIFSNPRL